ncbi:MAG TPA: hypothetical protein VJ879_02335 [Desulfobacter sp.]|nr:hypothetical protein [Desulfobacter sp.]
MTREEIMELSEDSLFQLVYKNFGVQVNGLKDSENVSSAWLIAEALARQGWGIDIRLTKDFINVDGHKFENGGPGTIFAQHGFRPDFDTAVEGICKTGLIALQCTGDLRE